MTPSNVLPMRRVPGLSVTPRLGGSSTPHRQQRWARSSLGLPQAGQTSMASYYTRPWGTSKPAIRLPGFENLSSVWPNLRESCNPSLPMVGSAVSETPSRISFIERAPSYCRIRGCSLTEAGVECPGGRPVLVGIFSRQLLRGVL
jgi:hypothetical protein